MESEVLEWLLRGLDVTRMQGHKASENRHLKAQQATHLKLIHNKGKRLQDKDTELQRKESTVNTQRQRIQQLLEQLAQAR